MPAPARAPTQAANKARDTISAQARDTVSARTTEPIPVRKAGVALYLECFPWRYLLVSAVPVGLLVYYLTQVAPGLVPIPPGVRVPFPSFTHALEKVSVWCGRNQALTIAAGAGLLLGGFLSRFRPARYYVLLTILMSLTLGLAYYSISAPVDRLLKAVESQIQADQRFPDPSRK